jgi:hypothetical protein
MSGSALQPFPDRIDGELSRLVDDVVAVIFERDPARFLKAHYIAVDGAEQARVRFEFDWVLFDTAFSAEFGAALRARGFELPRGEIVVGH